jgi:UDP-N-acetylglucosamine 2-epimerase (non-hydrolysing)/UDP-N-acetylglucosamine 2-epimerase (hydrolysing)
MAPVVMELRRRASMQVLLCTTGQHAEMMAQALADFDLTPDADLGVMSPGQSLASLTASLMSALDAFLAAENPDVVLVQGDTTSVLCAALAAFYRRIPVGHVEAGLRTHDRHAPFPEEINRCLAGQLAEMHFAPTEVARANLLREGVPAGRVHVTGNTVVDALLWISERIVREPASLPLAVQEAKASGRRVVLLTAHRRENSGVGIAGICAAVINVAKCRRDVCFVFPVHLTPSIREAVFDALAGQPGVVLLEPLPYRAFVAVMMAADVVLTDSGGMQEEAPVLGKPVLVMRDVTERPEAVAAGSARLVGTHPEAIAESLCALLDDRELYARMSVARSPYGDGRSAEKICDIVEEYLAVAAQPGETSRQD